MSAITKKIADILIIKFMINKQAGLLTIIIIIMIGFTLINEPGKEGNQQVADQISGVSHSY